MSPPLTIFERALLDYNFYFRAIHSDLTQDFEGTRNNVTSRATGYIALEPNGSLYGCAKCFSLATRQVLGRQEKQRRHMNHVSKKQKIAK